MPHGARAAKRLSNLRRLLPRPPGLARRRRLGRRVGGARERAAALERVVVKARRPHPGDERAGVGHRRAGFRSVTFCVASAVAVAAQPPADTPRKRATSPSAAAREPSRCSYSSQSTGVRAASATRAAGAAVTRERRAEFAHKGTRLERRGAEGGAAPHLEPSPVLRLRQPHARSSICERSRDTVEAAPRRPRGARRVGAGQCGLSTSPWTASRAAARRAATAGEPTRGAGGGGGGRLRVEDVVEVHDRCN